MSAQRFDAVIIGAGFAGLHMLWRLRQSGLKVRVLEEGDGVGGTWYWNRYPGARCDTESVEYSFGFDEDLQQEWSWTEKYSAQPEILSYANHVADRFDLRKDIQFESRVASCTYDDERELWVIRTERCDSFEAKFCITATGCLSAPNFPEIPGLKSFNGRLVHTGRYPKEGIDFKGKKVGFVGTGATGIQAIPEIAKEADHLYVFQRTPNFALPARNRPIDQDDVRAIKARYREHREQQRRSFAAQRFTPPAGLKALEATPEEREKNFEERWIKGRQDLCVAYADIGLDEEANKTAADFVRKKIRSIVKDPRVAEMLCPTDHPLGAKRISLDTNYFDTYNRPNVTLVDIRKTPIEQVTPTGLRTRDRAFDIDILIFATGFDAVTGPLLRMDIRGKAGLKLNDVWAHGPKSYLGLMVAGFPNFFTITGPGSPSVLANVIFSIDQHVDWIGDCIAYLKKNKIKALEPTEASQEAWGEHVAEVGSKTLFTKANNWYLGANVPGKPRVFLPYVGGLMNYRAKCEEIVAKGYEGFTLTPAASELARR
jgi:cation diffusion facilitator CzcD-associated flavoprotein CzcO